MSDGLPWVEKYRPETLESVAGNEGIIETIRQFIKQGQLPHLLFYGPPGTGKTSTIIAIAKEIFGKSYRNMILELNASDDRGIDVVREQIKTFASTRQMFGGNSQQFKLIVLDEADSMTNVAQNALRRIIEKYSQHTRFCILANYTHKLNPALISRCTRFRFQPIGDAATKEFLEKVIAAENVNITEEALNDLIKLSKGDMRRNLNVLQACHARAGGPIEPSDIYECVGSPDPKDIELVVYSLMNDDWSQCLPLISNMKQEKGLALADMLTMIGDIMVNVELDEKKRAKILTGLSDIEYRLSSGGSEKIQTSGMIGVVRSALD
ncbi:replication factor C subunit 3 [Starmerella bacillaris]|uniref:Replication factor C subunit 3 n=1 Tax=Starmerella bacillaris TaxID=1247836 RepID=A0AAV5RE88_STABA|nr:replication factor C subunit 3 [Starmerella bacillaris]